MSERYMMIDRLRQKYGSRIAYTKASVSVNIASQIKALRLRRDMTQDALAKEAEMMQSRISAIERPGGTGLSIETLVRLASAFKVGLIVKFASYSEMLRWENAYNQDIFDVICIDEDIAFTEPDKHKAVTSEIIYLKQHNCGGEEYIEAKKESIGYLATKQEYTFDNEELDQGSTNPLPIMQIGG